MVDKQKNIIVTGVESSKGIHLSGSAYYWDSTYIWLAKYDSNGHQLWSEKRFPLNNFGVLPVTGVLDAYKTILSSDGLSYITIGEIWNHPRVSHDVFIMKTDLSGNMIWQKFLPRPHPSDLDIDITPLKEGGYAFVSTYQDSAGWPNVPTDIYYGKLDEDCDTIWTRTFSRMPYAEGWQQGGQITEAENGDLLILAESMWFGVFNIVIRTNKSGQVKWHRMYSYKDTSVAPSNTFLQEIAAMSITPQQQILLSGKFLSNKKVPAFDTIGTFSWFILTDTFGCIEPGCQLGDTVWENYYNDIELFAINDIDIEVYPNPVQDKLYIQVGDINTTAEFYITDVTGKKAYMGSCASNEKFHADVSNLSKGLYVLEVWAVRKRVKVYKIVK